ncbi:MAG: sodium:proton antiporter [Deferribacterota bacterium]|nr:sodium:proton antiporter [Deferribacterota bacterium]
MKRKIIITIIFLSIIFVAPSIASESIGGENMSQAVMKMAESLPLWSIIPFAGILLSIALFPLFVPSWWHHNFGKVSAFWGLLTVIPLVLVYKKAGLHQELHIFITDYFPFLILLWTLFTVAGGILLRGSLLGTPKVNTILIAIGTFLASWMGTMGAAMLMIRPFLRANKYRKYRTFMVCFFIFLVANIGGGLTPVGDPPLFIGFLHGVPFFWTTIRLLPHILFASICILIIYFFLDLYYYKKEEREGTLNPPKEKTPLSLVGWYNFILLGGVVASVIFSGTVRIGSVSILGIERTIESLLRDGWMIIIGIISLLITPRYIRKENDFTWFPIIEVGYLFAGIFATMAPPLLILTAGEKGVAAPLLKLVEEPVHYYWITGILSAFLDNTPTYYTFFTSVLGKFFAGMPEPQAVPLLLTQKALYLEAISVAAVFFGACTYIGNAPNFAVRSIAEQSGTPMPSFFGYIIKYSFTVLIPIFIVVALIFFV